MRGCKKSTGWDDRAVLSLIGLVVCEKAHTWWETNQNRIHTIDELEVNMRRRFCRQSMDYLVQVKEFASRQQKESEDILDYMDDMRKRASRIRPKMEEDQIIRTIVDNANDMYRVNLIARQFGNIEELNRYMEHLSSVKKIKPYDSKPYAKKLPYRTKSIQAIETGEADELGEEEDASTDEPEGHDMLETFVEALAREMKQFDARPGRPPGSMMQKKTTPKAQISSVKTKSPSTDCDLNEISCFGCGAANTYKRNCATCQNSVSKNGKAAL